MVINYLEVIYLSNVWIINLKDNRTGHDKHDDKKFGICLKYNIIAIGWGKESSRIAEARAFNRADNAIKRMNAGDYVWTKNPKSKQEVYLFRVVDDVINDYIIEGNTFFIDNDISKSRNVELVKRFSAGEKLPDGLERSDIVARSTAENVSKEKRNYLIEATKKYVASL